MKPKIEDSTLTALARCALKSMRAYFNNPENLQKYIDWHIKEYGFAPTEGYGIGEIKDG